MASKGDIMGGIYWNLGLTYISTTIYKIDNQQGSTTQHGELYSISCNNI